MTYKELYDCTNLAVDFIKKAYNSGAASINRFMKYAEKDNNFNNYLLTNKMEERKYECECRLLLPRSKQRKEKIKEEAFEFSTGIMNISSIEPEYIIAGEKIEKNNLAALVYFAAFTLKVLTICKFKKEIRILLRNILCILIHFNQNFKEISIN